MLAQDFWGWVHSDPELLYDGVEKGHTPGEDVALVIVKHPDTGQLLRKFEVRLDGLKDATKRDLQGVFRGERLARVMKKITRIVGYYSFVDNWNRSKLAELRDRQKGAKYYAVPEAA